MTPLDIARQLRSLAYHVVALAHNGLQAIERALALRPHVVLMDIRLQGTMDGIEAARHIQARAPIPVGYMSAHADAATSSASIPPPRRWGSCRNRSACRPCTRPCSGRSAIREMIRPAESLAGGKTDHAGAVRQTSGRRRRPSVTASQRTEPWDGP
jgi:CheY-like chemotaxis protein